MIRARLFIASLSVHALSAPTASMGHQMLSRARYDEPVECVMRSGSFLYARNIALPFHAA